MAPDRCRGRAVSDFHRSKYFLVSTVRPIRITSTLFSAPSRFFLSATFAFILTRKKPDARQLGWALASAMIAAYAFGTWLGYSVPVWKANDQDIYVRSDRRQRGLLVLSPTACSSIRQ